MILDDRERGLIELLPNATVQHLAVGDISIGDGKIIIERKSVADLEASILDNRYREQRSRLMAYATENKAHPIYIIEGSLNRQFERLKKQALLKHLTRLVLRYHIAVFHTADKQETAELCTILESQFNEDPTTFDQPATMTYVETRGATREANSDDPKVFFTSVLRCVRGVSAAGAVAIAETVGSLEGAMKASAETFAEITCGKRKLGKVVGTRIHSLLHSI